MIKDFDRDGLIGLLQQLNSDEDEKVLAAARALRGGLRASGKTWDDLLRDTTDEPSVKRVVEDTEDDEVEEDETVISTASSLGSMSDDDAHKLIDRMIKKFKVSAMMREELEGYKEDIADGEFDANDRRYLQSVHDRLAK